MTRVPKPAGGMQPYESEAQARAVASPVYEAVRNLYGPAAPARWSRTATA